jgi:sugar/nucleoside kinase (ribokinase family)
LISASWNDSYDGRSPDHDTGRPWDVLGLGQAIVDFSATVSDDFLENMKVAKGGRRVITVEERGQILNDMEGDSFKANAGGSLSNSLSALARLGRADAQVLGVEPLRVGLGGPIGADALGAFYKAKIEKAGVDFISEAEANSATGTVVVLTTPDAQRSFLSYPGTSHDLVNDATIKAVSNCRILVIEGYLWEMPGAWEGIKNAITKAKVAGAIVVMSAGDPGVVHRHRNEMMKAIKLGVDVMFTNAEEAAALAEIECSGALESARVLGSHLALGIVTDGSRGAYLAGLGEVKHVEPHWATDRPVDTCGAGDAFAAGVLYGLLNGFDVEKMGRTGARVASAVISRYGARLKKEDALQIVREIHSPLHLPKSEFPKAKEVGSVVSAAALKKAAAAEQQ